MSLAYISILFYRLWVIAQSTFTICLFIILISIKLIFIIIFIFIVKIIVY